MQELYNFIRMLEQRVKSQTNESIVQLLDRSLAELQMKEITDWPTVERLRYMIRQRQEKAIATLLGKGPLTSFTAITLTKEGCGDTDSTSQWSGEAPQVSPI